ncbi:hypothetical protein MIMGU_mgv1a021240mg [Erythranthe guttata]|uniref:ZF-HD dimerization-type domain-containing protein n=1 Tax=Erythranthe guttata TaxID=4155 RepID=A0A022QAG0_ERYGU|nr:hypothetical protein MIMGU_mgv1a021240mg [Erythranthe guttata]
MATDNALKVEIMLVMYKECMHNHAASNGGFLLDGCGLFETPSGTTTGSREAMLCAVCGCHRHFHQRVVVEIPQHRQKKPASHPDQQQQPTLHPHQPQQPASHQHHHRCGGGSGRGTMIIRREPASAPGRFAPEQAAARRHALTTSPATRPVQRRPHIDMRSTTGSATSAWGACPPHKENNEGPKRNGQGLDREERLENVSGILSG